jgi:hypothetical protein
MAITYIEDVVKQFTEALSGQATDGAVSVDEAVAILTTGLENASGTYLSKKGDLDATIDYEAMYDLLSMDRGKAQVQITNLRKQLNFADMRTYRDLVEHFSELGDIGKRYGNRTIRNPRLKTSSEEDLCIRARNPYAKIGGKRAVLLYRHLQEKNIEVFKDGYTPAELGERTGKLDYTTANLQRLK